jgi:hypothetical protein
MSVKACTGGRERAYLPQMYDIRHTRRPARHAVAGILMVGAVSVGLAARVGNGHAVGVYASAIPDQTAASTLRAPTGVPTPGGAATTTATTTAAATPQSTIGGSVPPSQTSATAAAVASDPPARACCPNSGAGPVTVGFNGLTSGMRLPSNRRYVEFSVTFANYTGILLPQVAPVVIATPYAGAPGAAHIPLGILQRRDPTSGAWQNVPLGGGGPAALLSTGDPAAFVMPPGWMQTVTYRVQLSPQDKPGTLVIKAMAVQLLDHADLDNTTVPVLVTAN